MNLYYVAVAAVSSALIVSYGVDKQRKIDALITPEAVAEFGELRGIPPEIEEISYRMENGYYVSPEDQMKLSEYIDTETRAWNEWVESLDQGGCPNE
jgi:hypothetical protein